MSTYNVDYQPKIQTLRRAKEGLDKIHLTHEKNDQGVHQYITGGKKLVQKSSTRNRGGVLERIPRLPGGWGTLEITPEEWQGGEVT